jgi:hypothetical protein
MVFREKETAHPKSPSCRQQKNGRNYLRGRGLRENARLQAVQRHDWRTCS